MGSPALTPRPTSRSSQEPSHQHGVGITTMARAAVSPLPGSEGPRKALAAPVDRRNRASAAQGGPARANKRATGVAPRCSREAIRGRAKQRRSPPPRASVAAFAVKGRAPESSRSANRLGMRALGFPKPLARWPPARSASSRRLGLNTASSSSVANRSRLRAAALGSASPGSGSTFISAVSLVKPRPSSASAG